MDVDEKLLDLEPRLMSLWMHGAAHIDQRAGSDAADELVAVDVSWVGSNI
jgi:hypothetical protein